jgi:hypothetical protein
MLRQHYPGDFENWIVVGSIQHAEEGMGMHVPAHADHERIGTNVSGTNDKIAATTSAAILPECCYVGKTALGAEQGETDKGKAALVEAPTLVCYATKPDPPQIVPAHADRDWMSATYARFALRCIPLSIANSSGWELLCPVTFKAWWHGGILQKDMTFTSGDLQAMHSVVSSHFGHGVLTFDTGYVFRTSPGWALWVRGAPNAVKDGIVPLEGLVETDWLPFAFTMNWRFTRTGKVRFEQGEPFCFITPVPHAVLDSIEPLVRDLSDDPELAAACRAWGESRVDFNARLLRREPDAVKEGWQRSYVRGENPHGKPPEFHLSKRRLKPPRSDRK